MRASAKMRVAVTAAAAVIFSAPLPAAERQLPTLPPEKPPTLPSDKSVPAPEKPAPPVVAAPRATTPDDYVIGTDDELSIMFWRDKDMSSEAVVRPDGKITLPLINDIQAAGLTPDQLRERLNTEAARFLENPSASVFVKVINSRKVFITGEVQKPGPYPLTGPMTVLQLIATAGGLREYARRSEIVVMRQEGGKQLSLPFDYEAISKRTKLDQNIMLRPGDTVLVP